jgi:plastocyanin
MKSDSWNMVNLIAMISAITVMDQGVWGVTTNVDIAGFQFVPANVTINVGDTVMWTMQDSGTIHNAVSTSQPPVFASPILNLGQTYSFTFASAGTFPYICTIHPAMQGSVVVQEAVSTNPPPVLQLGSIVDSGNGVTLNWAGGTSPYLVQKKSSLMDTNWLDVLTTSELSVTVPKDTTVAFYRVGDQALTPVIALTVLLSGESEVPPAASTATGVGLLSIKGTQLNYTIRYSGLVTNATAAHIHGPASTTNSAGVLFPLEGVAAATAGRLSGSHTLLPEELAHIVAGRTYVNVHSAANPGGEIRGQIRPKH